MKEHEKYMGSGDLAYHFLGWIRIHEPKKKKGKNDTFCYPHEGEDLKNAKSMWDFPYRDGWCSVVQGRGWGWCQPDCHESEQTLIEASVDAFVYQNCSSDINMKKEFCTGEPTVTGYGQFWNRTGVNSFELISHEKRKYKNNKTLEEQHHSTAPRGCFADAGGSVWKFFKLAKEKGERGEEFAVLTGVTSRYSVLSGQILTVADLSIYFLT